TTHLRAAPRRGSRRAPAEAGASCRKRCTWADEVPAFAGTHIGRNKTLAEIAGGPSIAGHADAMDAPFAQAVESEREDILRLARAEFQPVSEIVAKRLEPGRHGDGQRVAGQREFAQRDMLGAVLVEVPIEIPDLP